MVCHVSGHGTTRAELFWSMRKGKVRMLNNSTPIDNISYIDKVMRKEIVELHKSAKQSELKILAYIHLKKIKN